MKIYFYVLVLIVIISIFYIDRIEPFNEDCMSSSDCPASDNTLKNIINETISEFNMMSIEGFTSDIEYNSPQKKYTLLENIYIGLISIFIIIMIIPI